MVAFFLIVVVLWGLPMYVADTVLEKKNYSNMTGFLLGLFLGWLGVFVALLMPFKPKDK